LPSKHGMFKKHVFCASDANFFGGPERFFSLRRDGTESRLGGSSGSAWKRAPRKHGKGLVTFIWILGPRRHTRGLTEKGRSEVTDGTKAAGSAQERPLQSKGSQTTAENMIRHHRRPGVSRRTGCHWHAFLGLPLPPPQDVCDV